MGRSDGETQPAGRRVTWRRMGGPASWPADVRALAWVPLCALPVLAAFPPLEWHLLGWVALAPALAALRAEPARTPGRSTGGPWAWAAAGWAYGWVFWGVQFAWLYDAFVTEAGMGRLHFANTFALLLAVLALGPAAAFGLARAAWLRWRITPLAALPVLLAALDALLGVAPFGGLGWGSLAGPQAATWAARVLVPLLGGSGLVLALGLVNAGWAAWARGVTAVTAAGPGLLARLRARGGLAAAGLLWAVATGLFAWPAPAPPPSGAAGAPLPMLLVPGDLSLATLDAQRNTTAPLRSYLGRTLHALAAYPPGGVESPKGDAPASGHPEDGKARPVLALWPESAVPGTVERGHSLAELARVGELVGADFLLGSNAWHRGRETNALYLVTGAPFDFRRYDKQRLVPFGEYVPGGFGWLFRRKVTAGEADYAAGSGPPVLAWRGVTLGLSICFESILPRHARAAVDAGAAVLVAAANDAWLSPSARRQHLQLSALRGLEVGRDVVFVANRGWSAHLRGGRPLALAHWRDAPLRVAPVPRGGRTPVTRWGLWPLLGACALVAAWAAAARGVRRARDRGRGGSAEPRDADISA